MYQLALEVGVDSVMVDGSAMAYDDNLAFTRRMVQLAQVMSASEFRHVLKRTLAATVAYMAERR